MSHQESSAPAASAANGQRIRRLLLDHLDEIVRYLGRLGIPSGEVDDVAQEVFLVATSKLADVPSGSDRAFLYAIASRVAHNARRANARRRRAHERYLEAPPDPLPSQEDLSDQLRARTLFDSLLRDMTPDLRGVFLLCEVEELAIPEVARRLAVPVGTATSRLRRAREALADRVARARAVRHGGALGRAAQAYFDQGPEILSWWVSDGEVDALRALLDIYRRSHPGTSIADAGIRDTTTAKNRLSKRMAAGAPPDTFQANGGHDLLQWARGERSGSLEPLEFLFEDEGWNEAFPRDVLDLVSSGGEAYAVPLNIHRTNAMVYDIGALAKAEVEPPRTLDDLHRALETLRRRGIKPLALGTRQPWMLSLLAFENLLVALAGPRFYLDYFQGKRSPRVPEVRAAVEELGRLLDGANVDAHRLSWDEAADRVRIGGAAMTLGGDWIKGYLERRGCFEGEHFGMQASPGTDGAFVFTMDAFGLPRGAPHREGAIELLRLFGSPHGQSVFSRIKGSRPARVDVALPSSDLSDAPVAFEQAVRVPTLTSLVSPRFSGAIDAALAEFARRRDVDEVMTVIEREYAFIGAGQGGAT